MDDQVVQSDEIEAVTPRENDEIGNCDAMKWVGLRWP